MLDGKCCNVCGTFYCEPEGLPSGCPLCRHWRDVRRKEVRDKWLIRLGVALFFIVPGAAYFYLQAEPDHVTSIFDFSDPAAWITWLILIFNGLMCALVAYVLITSAWKWLREKNSKIQTGKTTLRWVLIDAILLLIVAWFFGSAGMRFISQ